MNIGGQITVRDTEESSVFVKGPKEPVRKADAEHDITIQILQTTSNHPILVAKAIFRNWTGISLETLSLDCIANPYGPLHAAMITKNASWMNQFVAVQEGPTWTLATTGDAQDTNKEFVCAFQGIICNVDLPPFTEKIGASSVHVRHLRQSVSLTGFNTSTFETVCENIAAIHDFFASFIGKDSLQELTSIGRFEDHRCIDTSNRYFTSRRQGTSGPKEIPLKPDVDPHGYLMAAAGTALYHSEENEVYYYERVVKDDGDDYRFIPTKPITFRQGDIVEVQVTFALLPLRDNKYKLSLILRSVSLLEAKYSQRAIMKHILQASAPKKVITLKRKVGYTDEEIGTTRARLARMEVTDREEAEVSSQAIGMTKIAKHLIVEHSMFDATALNPVRELLTAANFSPLILGQRDAPVPPPNVQKLNSSLGGDTEEQSTPEAIDKQVEANAEQAAKDWLEFTPRYRIPGVKLTELRKRGKNLKDDIDLADATIALMKDWPVDACSARLVDDESEETLVCVFSYRMPAENAVQCSEENEDEDSNSKNKHPCPNYPGSHGRTLRDVKTAPKCHWDGIPTDMLQRYHEITQELHSLMPPHVNKRDIRHPSETVMTYTHQALQEGPEYVRDGVGEQAHKNHRMTPSKDMIEKGSCGSAVEVKRYFIATRPVALHLSKCFEVAFPQYYIQYKAGFKAGVWMTEDPGPWLGRAIVWKLQVKTHMDGLDDGPTAIFNMGDYTGGELYLPDLKVKLEYKPGSLIIFLSGQLYHCVGEWKPAKQVKTAPVTTGRVGNVFFFPRESLEKLTGKNEGWNVNTLSGKGLDVGKN
ncbi:hypothetical protein M413DRAFT_32286 [Hebeloma cylindrosporum]|uniref:Uncharacterized protein n=1 Tax=Hebeloma cylindrosporum TaxID=76867 RepID=A0A0C3BUJ2_HEBCY|nr:hypothetical protein M413DRAFT_32286 [Hebeloma cylindrosporum h7]